MLFGKQNKKEEVQAMFDMEQIGLNLMKYRKAAGMTQMQLADKLGISFQAVSNWERGQSCPDISKLAELSELLGVTIDELLGNSRAGEIVGAIQKEKTPVVTSEEFEEIAPILTQEQADRTAEKSDFDISEIKIAAPYLSEDFVGRVANEFYSKTGNLQEVQCLFPFMSWESLAELAKEVMQKTNAIDSIRPMLPFMAEDDVDKYAMLVYEQTGDLQSINAFYPFMYEDSLSTLAERVYSKTHSLESLRPILPFLDSEDIEKLIIRK